MNQEELKLWKQGVEEHTAMLHDLVDDRRKIKDLMMDHLKKFFDWDEIKFSREFDVVTIDLKDEESLFGNSIAGLGMDWEIIPVTNHRGFDMIRIKVYPFGRE